MDAIGKHIARVPYPDVAERMARDPGLRARLEAEEQRQFAAEREAYRSAWPARLERHLLACGALERDAELVATGKLNQNAALKAAREFWDSGKSFLALVGPTDTGKTVAAVSLLAHLVRPVVLLPRIGPSAEYDSAAGRYHLADELARDGYFGDATQERLEWLATVPLLVLDELGTETLSGPWLSTLNSLLNRRYGAKLRTVLLSNLDWERFARTYGERIARRITHDGVREVLGPDAQGQGKRGAR